MAEPLTLSTARLLLRPWHAADLDPYAALCADPEVMAHFAAPNTRAQCAASITAWTAHFAEHGFSNWALEHRDSGAFIGFVGLTVPRRVLPFSPCVEIGWRLARSAWGQGLASEGAQAVLAAGFTRFGLAEIVSFTTRANQRSRALMQRLGMQHSEADDFEHPALPEGHAQRPHVLYRLSRAAWPAGRAAADAAGDAADLSGQRPAPA